MFNVIKKCWKGDYSVVRTFMYSYVLFYGVLAYGLGLFYMYINELKTESVLDSIAYLRDQPKFMLLVIPLHIFYFVSMWRSACVLKKSSRWMVRVGVALIPTIAAADLYYKNADLLITEVEVAVENVSSGKISLPKFENTESASATDEPVFYMQNGLLYSRPSNQVYTGVYKVSMSKNNKDYLVTSNYFKGKKHGVEVLRSSGRVLSESEYKHGKLIKVKKY